MMVPSLQIVTILTSCLLALAKASEDWPGEGLEEVVVHYDEVVVASSARPSVTEPSETK